MRDLSITRDKPSKDVEGTARAKAPGHKGGSSWAGGVGRGSRVTADSWHWAEAEAPGARLDSASRPRSSGELQKGPRSKAPGLLGRRWKC